MVRINALTVNGVSTTDMPFPIYVEQNDGFRYPKKKNELIETSFSSGALKRTVNAWEAITKEYVLYCPTATLKDLRQLKMWASDEGKLVAADEPDVYYEILDVNMNHSLVDSVTGYRIEIEFACQPFGFEHNPKTVTYTNGSTITNHTNAPMFPRITVYGSSNKQTSIAIGDQRVYLRKIQGQLIIECKYLEQNVFDQYSTVNGVMRGEFFIIPKDGKYRVQLGEGIQQIDVLERWCWL